MRHSKALTVVVLVVALAAVAVAEDSLTTTVKAMARVGRCGSPSFSPDDKSIAFISDMSGVPQVWMVSAEGGWPRQITALDDPVGGVAWSPKGDWLAISVAPGGGMNTQVYILRPDGTDLRLLTSGGKSNNWLGEWTHDGSALMVSSNLRSPAVMDSYLLDVPSGKMRLVTRNEGVGSLVDVSRDNRWGLVARVKSRGDNNLFLVDLNSGKETLLTPHEGPGEFGGLFSHDARTIYLSSNKDSDLSVLARIKLGANGEPGAIEPLLARDDAEFEGGLLNEQGTQAVLVWNHGGRDEISFFDPATNRSVPGPELPAELTGRFSWSLDGRRLAVAISGSSAPVDVWVMDVASKKLIQLTFAQHAGVDLTQLVRPKLVQYKAQDGLPLSGWLYLPKNVSGPVPMVLSFHGGPEGQEVPAFRSDYQALLSQGIGVFAPNVRGSAGFGKKFVNLDNGALRVNAVQDIKASADYLVQNKIADPKRLGIVGGSYGGYMVMAGITEFPDLFAASADLFGVVNFETFFAHTEPWMAAISTIEYGDPKTQAQMLRDLSPIYKLDRVKAATIVLHGANDTNVPVVEAEQVVNTLKKQGVPVEYVLFPDEGHGWRKVNNRIRSTVEITRWFVKYLGEPASAAVK